MTLGHDSSATVSVAHSAAAAAGMLTSDEYDRLDGLAMAALVRSGEVSATELLKEAIRRIEDRNPMLNAVVRPLYDSARSMAALCDSKPVPPGAVFAGVPFLIKDLGPALAGDSTTSACKLLQAVPLPADSELVRRWRRAGLVFVGRTNTPEFGLMPFTEPKLHGPTRNPWNLERSPGGSSGGSAAAVAAGLVPLAHGNDGGGSIRIPASCCGLFGLKPSRGRTPMGPFVGELWRGFSVEHVLTRSVRDSAAALDATCGDDAGAPYAAPVRARPFLAEVATEPGPLRIAFTADPLFRHGLVHQDCRKGLSDATKLLEGLGHALEEAKPPIDPDALALDFQIVVAAEARAMLEMAGDIAGKRPVPSDVEPATWTLALLGRSYRASEYSAALSRLQLAGRTLGSFFERYDVFLTPTLALPPVVTGALQPTAAEQAAMAVIGSLRAGWLLRLIGIIEPMADKIFGYMPFTALFNASGQPAMSVPLCWNEEGLPIGMQFAARYGDEATLFRLAGQLERAKPWFDRRPTPS